MIRTEVYKTVKPLFLMVIGGGKVTHLGIGNDETLCGREGQYDELRGDICAGCHKGAMRMETEAVAAEANTEGDNMTVTQESPVTTVGKRVAPAVNGFYALQFPGRRVTCAVSKFSRKAPCNKAADPRENGAEQAAGMVTCKACLKVANIYPEAPEKKDANMSESDKVIEQIQANIERVRSLAEAENVEGLAALSEETEELISTALPKRGKIGDKSVTQVRKDLRAELAAASVLEPKPAPKAEVVVLETRDYHAVDGVPELVTKGAEMFTDGVRAHLKASDLAKDIARVLLEMRARMTDKFGDPDIKASSHGAKQASQDMYAAAGQAFLAGGTHNILESKAAVAKLQRSVQNFMPTARAAYLRELDSNPEEAALFAAITAKAEDGKPASEAVAEHYEVELKSRYELDVERAELEAAGETVDSDDDKPEAATPEEQIGAFFNKAADSIERAEKALKKVDDTETKESVKGRIDALIAELATLKAGL